MNRRIGIYAGTFDPVHSGHIAFALQALQITKLDMVYFLPERKPRYKVGVEHFGHRVAMLKRAVAPHPQFAITELTDVNFSIQRSFPQLQKQFTGDQLVFLFGSDVVYGLPHWPHAKQFLRRCELVVGVRAEHDAELLKAAVDSWSQRPSSLTMFASYAPQINSSSVREALRTQKHAAGLLESVHRYSNRNWLYVSVPD